MIGLGPRPRPRCYSVSLPPPPPHFNTFHRNRHILTNPKCENNDIYVCFTLSRSIGRHYTITLPNCPTFLNAIMDMSLAGESIWFHMSRSIGRHYIIRRDITTKLYIMHYGYVIQETYMHFFQVYIHIMYYNRYLDLCCFIVK